MGNVTHVNVTCIPEVPIFFQNLTMMTHVPEKSSRVIRRSRAFTVKHAKMKFKTAVQAVIASLRLLHRLTPTQRESRVSEERRLSHERGMFRLTSEFHDLLSAYSSFTTDSRSPTPRELHRATK